MKHYFFLSMLLAITCIIVISVILFSCEKQRNIQYEIDVSLTDLIINSEVTEIIQIDICTPDDKDIKEWTIYHAFTSRYDIIHIVNMIKRAKKNSGIVQDEKIKLHTKSGRVYIIDWTPDHKNKIIYFNAGESKELYSFFKDKEVL